MTVQYNIPDDGSGRVFLLMLEYVNEVVGISQHYAIEVVDGKLVSSGDLEPDAAARIFFDTFKQEASDTLERIAARLFTDKDVP